jgi:hypothetical protein
MSKTHGLGAEEDWGAGSDGSVLTFLFWLGPCSVSFVVSEAFCLF